MKISVKNWDLAIVEEVEVSDSVFAVPERKDIVARVIAWQLAKRRSGNHKTKEIGDVSGTTRKPFKQKGTGRARAGSLRSPQFRKGAVIFGPVVRSHAFSLPKKIRALGLKVALSARLLGQSLDVFQDLSLKGGKTREMVERLRSMQLSSVLFVDGPDVCPILKRAVSNIPHVDVLPSYALNVYDIVRHRHVILSKAALIHVQERFQ